MDITSYFSNQGAPATGLSPVVTIREILTGYAVVNGAAMSEIGGGFYRYAFISHDPTKEYVVISDGGSGLSTTDRYSVSATSIETDLFSIEQKIDSLYQTGSVPWSYPPASVAMSSPEARTDIERSQWLKQKQPVIQAFIDGRRKLVSAVAGRGFLLAPGFLYEFETGLEVDAKQKLSEVSYAILNESVDRELKQAGIDYDIAYKYASMAWEINKQTLLSDWDKELAGIKQTRSLREEELDRLAVEVSRRGIVLINSKNAIELQAEALRAQLAGIEDGAVDYEVQLAQQKLVTANKKLEVIPILKQILAVERQIIIREYAIVEKERMLVESETEKVGYLSELVDVAAQIAEKKTEELLPVTQELIGATQELVTATRTQIENDIRIMAQKVIDAGLMVDKAEKQIQITESQVDAETVRLAVMDAKLALAAANRQYDLAITQLAILHLAESTEQKATSHESTMNQERETQSNVVNLKTETVDEKLAQDILSSGELASNSVYTTTSVAGIHADATLSTARLRAISQITAELKHLIG